MQNPLSCLLKSVGVMCKQATDYAGCILDKDNYPHIKETLCVRLLIFLSPYFFMPLQRGFSVGNINYAFSLSYLHLLSIMALE